MVLNQKIRIYILHQQQRNKVPIEKEDKCVGCKL